MNSEIENASRYRTRKENRGKQNRDHMPDKELTITNMDHNEYDCIKDNSSSLTPGSPHPESLSELRAIPNWGYSEWRCFFECHASRHSHYECVAISNGFHECWLQAWEPLWKGASPCPGLLEGFRTFRLNPETDTPPKTFQFHAKSHSKSEDLPFCYQMPLGVHFKRHCAR